MGGSCGIRGKAWERRLKGDSRYTRSTDLICIVRVLNEYSLQQIEGENRVGRQLCEVVAVGEIMQNVGVLELRRNGYLQKVGTGGESERVLVGDRICNGWL